MDKTDRCDRCNAQAYVKTVIDTGLPLYWCSHHFGANKEALAAYTICTTDLRHMLIEGAR